MKEKSSQVEALRANIDRLKDTIVRMEKEKFSLEGKLKANKSKLNNYTIIDIKIDYTIIIVRNVTNGIK